MVEEVVRHPRLDILRCEMLAESQPDAEANPQV